MKLIDDPGVRRLLRDLHDRLSGIGPECAEVRALLAIDRRTPAAPPEPARLPPSGMCSCDNPHAALCAMKQYSPCQCTCHPVGAPLAARSHPRDRTE